MSKEPVTLVCDSDKNILLRSVELRDLSCLRNWKNDNRENFFHKETISNTQQEKWFEDYQDRESDYIFIVEVASKAVGCMGIRRLVDEWDVYNVILGLSDYRRMGIMTRGLRLMLEFAKSEMNLPISLNVLRGNLAINWYMKNKFFITAQNEDYFHMKYNTP
ncbi:MAG: GNAT family N-acetyltransferase [Pseudohongiella sp.]|nr:GNAT family N-acetyltransferase [Pseudohongiella sp.]